MTAILADMDAATRLLELLGLLHARPVWRGDTLADRLGVTRRTVRRDIARLRSLDYPVESMPGPHGGYRLGRGPELPPLVLDDQEALAVVLGLRTAAVNLTDELDEAAATALAKLERVLPERLAERVRDLSEATVAVGASREIPADPDQLLLLAQACRRTQRVTFMYTAADGARTMRRADPYRLVHVARRWYVLAWDLDRVDWRTFRVDRLTATFATGEDGDLPEEPDAQAMVRRAISYQPYPIRATIRLHVPADEAETWLPASAGLLEAETDDTAVWSTGASDPGRLAGWLASFPCRVEVLEPDELADALRAHVRVLLGED